MQEEIISKGYELNLDKIKDGELMSKVVCSADNRNIAKAEILKLVRFDGLKLRYTGEEVTYLNLPIQRAERYDVVMSGGKQAKRVELERQKAHDKRMAHLDGILSDPNIQYCYIRKSGSYYAPNNCGYTQFKFSAGVYTKKDAVSSAKGCEELILEPINIEEHNTMMRSKINDLETRIINQ